MKEMGIYIIKNNLNEKVYIGSSKEIPTRIRTHIRKLRKNQHQNFHLQNAWNKYGESSFSISTVEIIKDIDNLIEREQYWVDFYNACNDSYGYNLIPPKAGGEVSEEMSLILSERMKGNPWGLIKLDEEKVMQIKKILQVFKRVYMEDIAKLYGVTRTSIEKIRDNEMWASVKLPNDFKLPSDIENKIKLAISSHRLHRLLDYEVKEIKLLLRDTQLYNHEIGEMYKVKQSTISNIKNRNIWAHIKITEKDILSSDIIQKAQEKLRRRQPSKSKLIHNEQIEQMLYLKNVEKLTYEEIAGILNISKYTVGIYIRKIKNLT
ncbi:GIY-YIG nuclease family protein [Bacillus infantis]|uniref:GIY-YIG nuclease family protein n=1 Tax=Bacillus infantis TaxID=324767 RepID=UPI00209FB32A|nr:GIY-YIG nuclease family protein [Bacillus infantis]MCP1159471.1 GIY-YIG nuclease family protein [Bacillus infantis]